MSAKSGSAERQLAKDGNKHDWLTFTECAWSCPSSRADGGGGPNRGRCTPPTVRATTTEARVSLAWPTVTQTIIAIIRNVVRVHHAKCRRAVARRCRVVLVRVFDSIGVRDRNVGTSRGRARANGRRSDGAKRVEAGP